MIATPDIMASARYYRMITVDEAFEKFRQRLELSETERQNAIRRHNEVRECIRGEVRTSIAIS